MQLSVTTDVAQAVDDALNIPVHPDKIIFVEEHADYPGYMVFSTADEDVRQEFYEAYSDWVSRHLILNELFLLEPFIEMIEADGWHAIFGPSCAKMLTDYARWNQPLEVAGFNFTDNRTGEPGQLYPFQTFSLNRALERATARARDDRFFFFGWGAGAGKTMASAAGAQELFNRGEIDFVMAFTLRRMKYNYCRFFANTELKAVVGDGTAAKRAKIYADESVQVVVNNYDKAHWDFAAILKRIQGRRVLFILDEVQKVTTDDEKIRTRKALDSLIQKSKAIVWPMTASAVQETPLNYRDIFKLSGGSRVSPLGTRTDFLERYCLSETTTLIPGRTPGSYFTKTFYDWDKAALHEVRHRVGHCTQNVRKTDPCVRENFKGMQTWPQMVQMSDQDRRLYNMLVDLADQARAKHESLLPYYTLMRYVCNTPEALAHSHEPLARLICEEFPEMITSRHCNKLEMLGDMLEGIRDAGDKAVVFTKWTNLGLHLMEKPLRERHIAIVKHWGTGMTDRASQAAQDCFKARDDMHVFLTSDAGAYGLNLPEARYVFSYECPFSYDDLMQRNARVDRSDSHLDGYTGYVMITEDTIEERIWRINNERRAISAATTGTVETLSYSSFDKETSSNTMNFLIFGEES
jgi:hypothetical protein